MATHSGTLALKIPWTEETVRLQSLGVTKNRTRQSNFTNSLNIKDDDAGDDFHSQLTLVGVSPWPGCMNYWIGQKAHLSFSIRGYQNA